MNECIEEEDCLGMLYIFKLDGVFLYYVCGKHLVPKYKELKEYGMEPTVYKYVDQVKKLKVRIEEWKIFAIGKQYGF